jgi:hypothetical protein
MSIFTHSQSVALTGLEASTGYVIQVRSVCSQEVASIYTSANFTTAGAGTAVCQNPAPVNIMPAITSALITWPPVTGATMYQVSFRRNIPGMFWTTVNRAPNTPNYLVTGLLPDTEYEVMVRSLCGSIRVPYPPSQNFTTQSMSRLAENENEGVLLSLYPNPNKGEFTASLTSPLSGHATLTVLSANGSKVHESTRVVAEGKNDWPVELVVPRGLYLLRVESAREIRTAKVVVE